MRTCTRTYTHWLASSLLAALALAVPLVVGCTHPAPRLSAPIEEPGGATTPAATTQVAATDGASLSSAAAAQQGRPCSDGACAAGLACMSYYGIAGPSGPRLSSCEVPCRSRDDRCPPGQACVTISDGPGRVCQAAPAPNP